MASKGEHGEMCVSHATISSLYYSWGQINYKETLYAADESKQPFGHNCDPSLDQLKKCH